RKQKAYQTHRNVYAHPATARAVIAALAKENLYVPEFEGLSDQDAAVRMEEWHMDWISRLRGSQAGVKYAEDYYFLDEFDYLPGLKEYLKHPEKPPAEPGPSGSAPPKLIRPKQVALVVTADASDYLLAGGGTIATLVDQGATVYVIRVTNDEKDSWDVPPEETARRTKAESEEAARILGVKEVISLGYRAAELAGVSFTEIRDRLIFYIRHYQPRVMFIPNPYTEYDRVLDRYYTGRAAEDAWRAAAFENFGPAFADVGLKPHLTPELYYFAQPFDPRRHEPESTATFVPQPTVLDISGTFQRKVRAVQALQTINYSMARRLKERFDATGRRLATLDDASRTAELNVRGLGGSEEFRYAGVEYRIPSKYRR
ncbi:MAG: PIG-L family deacetylase, partial [Acidobacteria bacterium]|nr:PIG-L family deacetylase [Acidobacteriota bacterium]